MEGSSLIVSIGVERKEGNIWGNIRTETCLVIICARTFARGLPVVRCTQM